MNVSGSNANTDIAWSSRSAFLFAAVGFAVGLGNIWRFPYMVGENGGGAFVLVYLLCVFVISLPILTAELVIGRIGRGCCSNAMQRTATQENQSPRWQGVGYLNLLAAFLVMLIYAGIVGWVLYYLYLAIITGFNGYNASVSNSMYQNMLGNNAVMIFWSWVGLIITGAITCLGLKKGVEKAVSTMIPLLLILLVLLAIYSCFTSGAKPAIQYLFSVDFSKINGSVFIAAIGQAFFSIGVGLAGMMTYGGYIPKSFNLSACAGSIIVADTIIALLAGAVIFPLVFTFGLNPGSGPGLIFETLPIAFAQMPIGHIFSILFFLSLASAGITTMVGFMESLTAFLTDTINVSRYQGTIIILVAIGALSLLSIFSYNVLSDWTIMEMNFNTAVNTLINNVLLPLGGLLIVLFTGWAISRPTLVDQLGLGPRAFQLWYFSARFVAPAALIIIFIVSATE